MNILQLNSSLNGTESVSTTIADAVASQLGGQVQRRDLNADPLPHLDATAFGGFNQAPEQRNASEQAAVTRSDALIDEVREADVLVIAAPMYNFGIPSTLKAWFDHVLRAGVTFRYTSEGPQGLLGAKRVIVVSSRGGQYAGTDADTHSAHMRQLIGFMGLGEPEFVYAEGMANPDKRAARIAELVQGAAAA